MRYHSSHCSSQTGRFVEGVYIKIPYRTGAAPGKPPRASAAPKAYMEPVAVRDRLTDMPLFLEPGSHVSVPPEDTYPDAFAAVARRWRTVLKKPD